MGRERNLRTVKQSGAALPGRENLLKAMEIAHLTVEGDLYLVAVYRPILLAGKVCTAEVSEKLNKYEEDALLKSEISSKVVPPWDGGLTVPSSFENLQTNTAEKLLDMIDVFDKEVKLDIAISDESELLRGYMVDGEPLYDEDLDAMDAFFNAWLATIGIVIQDSVLYKRDAAGDPQVDNKGKMIKANAEELRGLLENKDKGYAKFMKGYEIKMTAVQHNYGKPAQEEVQAPKAAGVE